MAALSYAGAVIYCYKSLATVGIALCSEANLKSLKLFGAESRLRFLAPTPEIALPFQCRETIFSSSAINS
jgi:hypothetical protein